MTPTNGKTISRDLPRQERGVIERGGGVYIVEGITAARGRGVTLGKQDVKENRRGCGGGTGGRGEMGEG